MTDVKVHVPVKVGYHGATYLLETIFDMDFLPMQNELFHPLKKDKESGLSFEVGSRHWDEDGKAVLQMGQYIIDPPESMGPVPRNWHAWWTDRDGDLVELLLANGWWHYDHRND